MKKALITGITGQDGSYLAELLLERGSCGSELLTVKAMKCMASKGGPVRSTKLA